MCWGDTNLSLCIQPFVPLAVPGARKAMEVAGLPLKLRRFSEASRYARDVPASDLQPAARRPKASSAVARRLIDGSLGGGGRLRDKTAEKELAHQRRLRAAQKEQREKAYAANWDDD
jgi:hypothetical protein